MLRSTIVSLLLIFLSGSPTSGWSDAGHGILGALVAQQLTEEECQQLSELLAAHPRFDEDFHSQEGSSATGLLVQQAALWVSHLPDDSPWSRPNWSYQAACTLKIGQIQNLPDPSLPLPNDAGMDSRDLQLVQAIRLTHQSYHQSQDNPSRAIALCWLLHLVAEAHQPCHAGSLYVENLFPEGDSFGREIRINGGDNLHTFWESVLGSSGQDIDFHEKAARIQGVKRLFDVVRDPQVMLHRTRTAARAVVYSSAILHEVRKAAKSGSESLPEIELTGGYQIQAERAAEYALLQASASVVSLLRKSQRIFELEQTARRLETGLRRRGFGDFEQPDESAPGREATTRVKLAKVRAEIADERVSKIAPILEQLRALRQLQRQIDQGKLRADSESRQKVQDAIGALLILAKSLRSQDMQQR
ncbi:MAG: hypothetical protein NXI32_16100 [bacterium]|nr:hypothetical protein [bacterium]